MNRYEVKIELTNRCKLKCIHCSTRACKTNYMEINIKLLRKILKMRKHIRSVVFTGGEPLLYSHLLNSLEIFNSVDLFPVIYTSGYFECAETYRLLGKLRGKVSKFIVSLHGTELVHDRVTQLKGSYSKTIEFVRQIQYAKIPIGIHIVALNENIRTIPLLVSWLKDNFICDISILRYVPQGRGLDRGVAIPSKSIIKDLFYKIEKDNVRFGAPFNYVRNNKVLCKAGRSTISIDAFGRVIPCDSYKEFSSFGDDTNLNQKELLEIVEQASIFKYARKNSLMYSEKECCIGQYLLSKTVQKMKWLSNG